MEKIRDAYKTVLNILGKAENSDTEYRFMKYCVAETTEEGILLFNLLTRELLLLTAEEYENALDTEYLKEHWFAVPKEFDEKEYKYPMSEETACKTADFIEQNCKGLFVGDIADDRCLYARGI